MKLQIGSNRMEEVEGLHNAYPYAYHSVDLQKTQVPWHWHEALEFGYVREGAVQVNTTTNTYLFHAGEGFFINTNVLTAMAHEGSCRMESHLFHSVFLAGHFKSVFETKYIDPVVQNRQIELVPLRMETAEQKTILQKLRQLSLLQQREDVEMQTRNLLSEIWLVLLEELRNTHVPQTAAGQTQERLLTMLAYIQQHYGEKLTLEEIAAAAAVSTRECLRCFRTGIRQSPMEYLIAYRIGAAKKLLETTALPITEVSLRTGFNSPAYFSKIFREHTGKTPNAYRKELVRSP